MYGNFELATIDSTPEIQYSTIKYGYSTNNFGQSTFCTLNRDFYVKLNS